MTRPVRLKAPRRKRERDTRPANHWMEHLLTLKAEDPEQFKRETKGKPHLVSGVEHYESVTRGEE